MIIRGLDIQRFGNLADQEVRELSPELNIFLGRNEAGKSTCLNFFRAMFFGYKRGGKNDTLDYFSAVPDPAGGRKRSGAGAGGGLELQTSGGTCFRLNRRPGKHGGELSLTDAKGASLPADYLSSLLGGVTVELYDRVFSFDLADISSLNGLKDSQVASALHGAAFGTGFRSPAEVLQELARKQGAIFSPAPTAKLPAVNALLKRLQEVGRKLSEQDLDLQRHAELLEEKATVSAALAAGATRLKELDRRLGRTRSLMEAWESWQDLRRIEEELKLTPHPGGQFAEDGKERLEALCAERAEKQAALAARSRELEGLQKQLDQDRPSTVLLEAWPVLQSLQARRLRLGRSLEALPAAQGGLEALEAAQASILASLGRGWTSSRVMEFDRSIAVRDLVLRYQERLGNCARTAELLARDRERLEREREQARQEEAALRAARGRSLRELVSEAMGGAADALDKGRPSSNLLAASGVAPRELALNGLALDGLALSGLATGDLAPEPLYGPEIRLRLEDLWKRLEQAGAARQAAALRLDSRAEDLSAAQEQLYSLRQKEAALPDGPFDALGPERISGALRELAAFRRTGAEIGQLASAKAGLSAELRGKKPTLLSPVSAGTDKRRLVPGLLSFFIALLAIYHPTLALGASSGPEFFATHWPALCLGLFAFWSALFWLSPRLASFGLLRPAPDVRELQLAGLEERLRVLEAEQGRLGGAILSWLPPELLGGPGAESGADCAFLLGALSQHPDKVEELEERLETLQRSLPLRQMLAEQLKRAELDQERAGAALAESRAELERLQEGYRLGLAAWDDFLRPYDLDGDCSLGTALQIYDRAAQAEQLNRQLRELGRRQREAGEESALAAREWEDWLKGAGFEAGLAPAVILDALALIEKYQERQLELVRRRKEAENCQSEITAFQAAWAELPPQLLREGGDLSREYSPAELPLAFDQLFRAVEAAVRQAALFQERQKDLAALRGRLAEAEIALQQNGATLRELFELAGLAESTGRAKPRQPGSLASPKFTKYPQPLSSIDSGGTDQPIPGDETADPFLPLAEEFRLRFGQYRKHEQLRRERERQLLHMEQYVARSGGRGYSADLLAAGSVAVPERSESSVAAGRPLWQDREEFFAALEGTGREELSGLAAELSAQLEQAVSEREAALGRLREVEVWLEEMERGSGSAELKQEEAALRERLETLARRWGALALARTFIIRAKRSFEEERQDLVVRQAGDFFRTMTGGAYQGLNFDLESASKGGLKALALPRRGTALDSENSLSRGTREQLYLALRLAYIRQHNKTREKLPVIADDILVNFDPRRAALAAQVFAAFARENQVLFFTCHPELAEMLAEAAGRGAARFTIRDGLIEKTV